MNPEISHFLSNNVTLVIVAVIAVFFVLFRGANVNNRGGCLRTIVVVILLYGIYKYFTGSGSLLDLLPGRAGQLAQGTSAGMSMTNAQYLMCLQSGIGQTQLQKPAQTMCASQSGAALSTCLANVLCTQGGDAGCSVKTQCQFQQTVGGVPGNTGKGIVKTVLCALVHVDACDALPPLAYPAMATLTIRTDINYTNCLTTYRSQLRLYPQDGCGLPKSGALSQYNQCVASAISATSNGTALTAYCNTLPAN
jgi:hypothetical protein